MATNPIQTGTAYTNTTTNANRQPTNQLGKNEFLQILAVQMANQDPLEPTSDTEFIAQMAQFSSLEQMQEMNASTNSTKAHSMIGKFISAEVSDGYGSRQNIAGLVAGVMRSGGTDYLIVGDFKVPMEAVTMVYDNGVDQQNLIAQTSNLIGKDIVAEVATNKQDADGNYITEKVEGVVEYIVIENGVMYAKLKDTDTMKDKKVMISDIIQYGSNATTGTPDPGGEEEAGEA